MRTTDQVTALNVYGQHGAMALDAKNKVKKWVRPTYESWKKNEARAAKERAKYANLKPSELLYV